MPTWIIICVIIVVVFETIRRFNQTEKQNTVKGKIFNFNSGDKVSVSYLENNKQVSIVGKILEIDKEKEALSITDKKETIIIPFQFISDIKKENSTSCYERLGMDLYERYKDFTEKNDWSGICQLNGRKIDSWGTKKELKVLPQYLEKDEIVFAFCSGIIRQSFTSNYTDKGLNTWLVVLTNKRFLFLDHSFLTAAVDMQSVRHEKVQAVNASQGLLLGKVIIDIANRSIVVEHCQNQDVKIMAERANTWYSVLSKIQNNAEQQANVIDKKYHSDTVLDEIKKLGELKKSGILSQKEFQLAKKELLQKIGNTKKQITKTKKR